ncbi:LF1 [macacine gammaherpesvirus 10]|uniref:LF1 n=1 Tax=macacine gammaherpesvirus 10 TaxID=2560569 RepID=A0A0S0DLF6_9GAMA|nr:LF1 [macacine gammaherpesvirus 10]ALF03270.1 LF1 [macacine gammaherpesvirus 10]
MALQTDLHAWHVEIGARGLTFSNCLPLDLPQGQYHKLRLPVSAYEALAVARYGLVGSLWEVPAVNSGLPCLAAANTRKDVKIYPSCIFQVHAPMFVTIKTCLRRLNPNDLCLCLICVGAAILDLPLLCAPCEGALACAAAGSAAAAEDGGLRVWGPLSPSSPTSLSLAFPYAGTWPVAWYRHSIKLTRREAMGGEYCALPLLSQGRAALPQGRAGEPRRGQKRTREELETGKAAFPQRGDAAPSQARALRWRGLAWDAGRGRLAPGLSLSRDSASGTVRLDVHVDRAEEGWACEVLLGPGPPSAGEGCFLTMDPGLVTTAGGWTLFPLHPERDVVVPPWEELQVVAQGQLQGAAPPLFGFTFQEAACDQWVLRPRVWTAHSPIKLAIYNCGDKPLHVGPGVRLGFALFWPAERSDSLDAGRIFYQLTSGELHWGRHVARPPTLTLPVEELQPWPKLTPEEPMQH